MPIDRRQLLRYSPSFLLASSYPLFGTPALAARGDGVAALLVPQSGPYAALGRSMERAAMLAQAGNDAEALMVVDTGGTGEGTAAAAALARRKGAAVILGPLRSQDVPVVVAQTGGTIPVVAFGNDAGLRESGAFIFGITAQQTVSGILRYAAGRGIRRIAVDGADDAWTAQIRAAALAESTDLGLIVQSMMDGDTAALAGNFSGSEDGLPDAVLIADPARLARLMPQLAANNVQPLAAFPELDLAPDLVRTLTGTWLAAPDPTVFADFARAFEQRIGTRPGLIAGLAFDASSMVLAMLRSGGIDRSAVLSANGYPGVCGHVRFRENGTATRELAVLSLEAGGIRKVG